MSPLVHIFDEKSLVNSKIFKLARPIMFYIDENECHICLSHRIDRDGYRKIERCNREWLVHRYIWTLYHSEIPAGMEVRHKCHNPACMNIEHLELGTHKQNMEDKKNNPRPDKTKVRLTIEQKKEIANSTGKTIPQLAAEYNVSHAAIVESKRRFGAKRLKRMADKPSIPGNRTNTQKKNDMKI